MKLKRILEGNWENHIFPFLWVHGESEEVYRDNIRAIYDANIRAFCVEARPHEEFCRDGWWRDLDIILDEARKREMKVWILDDKHFPTGYANGGVEHAPAQLRRQSIFCKKIPVSGGHIRLSLREICHPEISEIQKQMDQYLGNDAPFHQFSDDRFLCAAAVRKGEGTSPVSLMECVSEDVLTWEAPEGEWQILICFLSRNAGSHRGYINMMDRGSCRILIDQVYEPHYAHYRELFGTVIAGFFSDEPELGNGILYRMGNVLGTDQDLPWSRELETALKERMGDQFAALLPLLWSNDCGAEETAWARYLYMDTVTRLVEEDFSGQIGTWCRERGVEYIGHVIEDNNQHARTGTSLGHYFRGMKWQSMAGIDDIGGQVLPQGEDQVRKGIWDQPSDPEFYHYALGKLGSSMGELVPHMQGRSMCEIFGNYGWEEGSRLEKYLLDHFMVRGINHFVPHAFSCHPYPDPDCPPHFYAHGHDPLYRCFGRLMLYTNRILSLLEDSEARIPAAILYHGEAEWAGACMLMQKPARILQDHQIDFRFVPGDIFGEPDFYRTRIGSTLSVNGKEHRILIVPYAQFLPEAAAEGIGELRNQGCPVVFLEGLPEGTCQGGPLPESLKSCDVIPLDGLLEYVEKRTGRAAELFPENNRIRVRSCAGEERVLYLVNEGAEAYEGIVSFEKAGQFCVENGGQQTIFRYDPWDNRLLRTEPAQRTGRCGVRIYLRPSESCLLVSLTPEEQEALPAAEEDVFLRFPEGGNIQKSEESSVFRDFAEKIELRSFRVSCCRSKDYPDFQTVKDAGASGSLENPDPGFSGFLRYETDITVEEDCQAALELTGFRETAELFVNGVSAGMETLDGARFLISRLCRPGTNQIRIEVATTLERENSNMPEQTAPMGLTGPVWLYKNK